MICGDRPRAAIGLIVIASLEIAASVDLSVKDAFRLPMAIALFICR